MSKPEPTAPDVPGEVARSVISGARWVMILNLATFPLAFVTNTILGRVSAEALGTYGAIQLLGGIVQGFIVIGGNKVFTRFVPALERRDRFPFFFSYAAIVLGLILVLAGLGFVVIPGLGPWALSRFGNPPASAALAFTLAVALVAVLSHQLWGVLQAARAAITLRAVVVGFFVCSLLGLGPLRARLEADPGRLLWSAAPTIYAVAAILGVVFVARTAEAGEPRKLRWFLPAGFWEVVLFTYLETVVLFVYMSMAPVVVLFWLDVTSLGYLHAALRWVALLETIPSMLTLVISPGLARLQAAGEEGQGLRQASAAMSAAILITCPIVLVLICFAPDAMALFGPEFRPRADLLRVLAPVGLGGSVVFLGGGMLVALGAVRVYLLASVLYVLAALGLTFGLIPTFGLGGAAWAALVGAWLNQTVVGAVLRLRLGFRVPMRVHVAWMCCLGASLASWLLDPGRGTSAAFLILFLALFVLAGRVSGQEIATALRRLLGRG